KIIWLKKQYAVANKGIKIRKLSIMLYKNILAVTETHFKLVVFSGFVFGIVIKQPFVVERIIRYLIIFKITGTRIKAQGLIMIEIWDAIACVEFFGIAKSCRKFYLIIASPKILMRYIDSVI